MVQSFLNLKYVWEYFVKSIYFIIEFTPRLFYGAEREPKSVEYTTTVFLKSDSEESDDEHNIEFQDHIIGGQLDCEC